MIISPDSIKFLLENSLVDASNGLIPVFLRSSSTTLERKADQDLTLMEIPAGRPAIDPDDGSIVLHPEGKNEVTWSANPSHSSWIKGSYITTFVDRDPSIDRTYLAERLIWTAGTGSSQLLRKPISLEAGQTYCVSLVAKLDEGSFRPGDLLRVTGSVLGAPQISLSNLNSSVGKRKKLSFSFSTAGGQPVIPQTGIDYYPIAGVTPTTITLMLGQGVAADDLIGAQILLTETSTKYLVSSNAASDLLGGVAITVNSPTLTANGVTTSGKAKIDRPPLQVCQLELYCENAATIEWGSVQIEKRNFPTAQIVQKDAIELRSSSIVSFNRSPVRGLGEISAYIDIRHWVGDGVIFSTPGLEINIVGGKIVASVGGTPLADPSQVPSKTKILLQVSSSKSQAQLFVDRKLVASATIAQFIGQEGIFSLTSAGVREYFSLSILNRTFDFGGVAVGAFAKGEVSDLFLSKDAITRTRFVQKAPELILPATIVPPLSTPPQSTILSLDQDLRQVAVREIDGFAVGRVVTIENEGIFILESSILEKVGNVLTLEAPISIVIAGYSIRQGDPVNGKATVRFPFDPLDVQRIVGVNSLNNTLGLAVSALSFETGRAIVQDGSDRFVTEVIITSVNTQDISVIVDSAEGIETGFKISQPTAELLVDPSNYLASFSQPVQGVRFSRLAQNGLEIENENTDQIVITPIVKIIL